MSKRKQKSPSQEIADALNEYYRHDEENIKAANFLFDIITSVWSEKEIPEYRQFKNISEDDDLQDNMSQLELIIDDFGVQIARVFTSLNPPKTWEDYRNIAIGSGLVARAARLTFEEITGLQAVSPMNARDFLEREGENKMLI